MALQAVASAAIDISDGLDSELTHLAGQSGACLAIEGARVPMSGALRDFARRHGEDPLQLALGSGEEFELLFTLPADRRAELEGADVTVIGEVREGAGGLLDGRPIVPRGWDHLRAP